MKKMRAVLLIIGLLWLVSVGFAQSNYRSVASGSWSDETIWEYWNVTEWVAADSSPDSDDGLITISDGTEVTIDDELTIDQLTIESGASLILSEDVVFTIADGDGDDLTINGTFTNNSASMDVSEEPSILVGSGGTYIHSVDGETIPPIAWHEEAVLIIQSDSVVEGLDQEFGIVKFDNADQVSSWSLPSIDARQIIIENTGYAMLYTTADNTEFSGDFRMTGGRFIANWASANRTTIIKGDLCVLGGIFEVTNRNTSNRIHSVVVEGDMLICSTETTTGTVNLNGYAANSTNSGRLILKGDLTVNKGLLTRTQTVAGGATGVYFDGSGTQTFTWSGGLISTDANGAGRRFYYSTAKGPSSLNEIYSSSLAQVTISGTEGAPSTGFASWPNSGTLIKNFTVSNNGGVTLSRNLNINDKLIMKAGALNLSTFALTYANDSSLEYSGTVLQTVGAEWPSSFDKNVLNSNSVGLNLNASKNISGYLTNNGVLNIGANTLTLSDGYSGSGTLTGGETSNLIIGGAAANLSLPSLSLNNLELNRANGASLAGNLTVIGELKLTSGTLSIGGNTLTLNGSLNLNGGSMSGGATSNLFVGGIGSNMTIPSLTLNNLTNNRPNGVTMSADLTVNGTLSLLSGALTIGANNITVNGEISGSGTLTGGVTSNMLISGSGDNLTLPTISNGLNNLTVNRSNKVISMNNNLSIGNLLTLSNGALSIGTNTLTLNGGLSITSGSLVAGSNSNIVISGTGGAMTLPALVLNDLTINRNAQVITMSAGLSIGGTLTMTAGTLSIGSNTLTLTGNLSGSGTLNGSNASIVIVSGTASLLSLPAITLGGLQINRANGVILGGNVTIDGNMTLSSGNLNVNGKTLTIDGKTVYNGGTISFATGTYQTDGYQDATNRINVPANDDGYLVNASITSGPLRKAKGDAIVGLQWTITGSCTGDKQFIFTWDEDDDNGYDWGVYDYPLFVSWFGAEPLKVTSFDPGPPRVITLEVESYATGNYSTYNEAGATGTLPVELASFTAILLASDVVRLNWLTQSETGVNGFYILRANELDLSVAEVISPMIAATNTSNQASYIYTDREIPSEGTYYYWLQITDIDGATAFYGPSMVEISFDNTNNQVVPLVTSFKNPYPNPFNPILYIAFDIAEPSSVQIDAYNIKGQIVANIFSGQKQPGIYNLNWNGTDNSGRRLATGTYYLRMCAGSYEKTRKVVLIK